jgi:hypothetical protein
MNIPVDFSRPTANGVWKTFIEDALAAYGKKADIL